MPERRAWSIEEDTILKHLKQEQPNAKWSTIAKKMAEEYKMPDRTGKQCRQRYHNHLDSTILRTEWTTEEEQHLYRLHDDIGNKWAIIAQKLPGRTDNCVKNHFYSKMRKAIRKINKIIYQFYKKQIKEIKMTALYKIVEATDQRFKNNPNIQQEISQKCCKLKNILLAFSNDDNQFQNDTQKIGQLAKQIHQFSSKYRRKAKKSRRSSVQGTDLLKIPKFALNMKSNSDCDDDDSEYSMVISHDNQEQNQDSFQIDEQRHTKQLQEIKQVDDLKQSTNSKFDPLMMQVNLFPPSQQSNKPLLIKPPPLIKPPSISVVTGRNMVQMLDKEDNIEQVLRINGIVQYQLQSATIQQKNPILKKSSLIDSVRSMEDENKTIMNFLSQSIQKMKIHDNINFEVEPDEQNKLFISVE